MTRGAFVYYAVARGRWGEGLTWGCMGLHDVTPSIADTVHLMKPQVSLTSRRAHNRAVPGAAPCVCVLVCMYVCRLKTHPVRVMGLNVA